MFAGLRCQQRLERALKSSYLSSREHVTVTYYCARALWALGRSTHRRSAELFATALSLAERLSSFERDLLRPILARSLAWLGRFHWSVNNSDQALKYWTDALDLAPDLEGVGARLTDELLRLGKLDKCASLLHSASEKGQRWPLKRFAMLSLQRGDYNEAVTAFQRLLRNKEDKISKNVNEVSPKEEIPQVHVDHIVPWRCLAESYIALGRYDALPY